MHKLTIVIVSYRSHNIIRENLASFLDESDFRIIVIDNANEEELNLLKLIHPRIEIYTPKTNLGYGRAANIGLNLSRTPYTLLLNPDLKTNGDDIKKLLRVARASQNTAILAPATLSRDYAVHSQPEQVKWVSGSAMIFNTQIIKGMGGFDENIFLFAEDTDLCFRAIKSGFTILLCRNIHFPHKVGHSSPPNPETDYMKWWHFGWSQCYKITKHGTATFWLNPKRKYISYLLHAFVSTSSIKRRKWKAKADGALAFISGIKAFREDGTPQMS